VLKNLLLLSKRGRREFRLEVLGFAKYPSDIRNPAWVKGHFHSVACGFWEDEALSGKFFEGFLGFATEMLWQAFYGVILGGMFLADNVPFKEVFENSLFNECRHVPSFNITVI